MEDIERILRERKRRVGEFSPFWQFKDRVDADGNVIKGNPVFVGRLLGSRPDPRDESRTLFDVETLDGEKYTLPSYALLNRELERVPAGAYVYIEYVGESKKPMKGGRRPLLFEIATLSEEEAKRILQEKPKEEEKKPPKEERPPKEEKPPKRRAEKPAPAAEQEPEVERGVKTISTLLEYYGELEEERARKALENMGIAVPLEALVERMGLRIEGGKVKK